MLHAAAQTNSVGTWLALGDSYSAGVGTSPPDPGTFTSVDNVALTAGGVPDPNAPYNQCHRTLFAYPRLFFTPPTTSPETPSDQPSATLKSASDEARALATDANLPTLPFRLVHKACNGAMVSDVFDPQNRVVTLASKDTQISQRSRHDIVREVANVHGSLGQGGEVCHNDTQCTIYTYQPQQISYVAVDTRLITLTVGGNDIGFADIAKCLATPNLSSLRCEQQFPNVFTTITSLTPTLEHLYRELTHRAPQATVVVLPYPQVLSQNPTENPCDAGYFVKRIDTQDYIWANRVLSALNGAIADAVAFVGDPRVQALPFDASNFSAHAICGTDKPEYINRARPFDRENSFHPNEFGQAEYARILALFLQKHMLSGTPKDNPPASAVDTALIIDSSGSMQYNDPNNQRLDAASAYLHAIPDGDRVAVIHFDSVAAVVAPLAAVPQNLDILDRAVRSIGADGGTDISAGLQLACQLLQRSPVPDAKKLAILLTDGDDNQMGGDSCFQGPRWPVYTIGFGTAVDSRLQTIAQDTGGAYSRVDTTLDLECQFLKIRDAVANVNTTCVTQTIQPGQTIVLAQDVPTRQQRVTFATSWPGSDVAMTLVAPSGRVIGRSTDDPDVDHQLGARYELFSVRQPEPGQWRIQLYGRDVHPGGESVVFTPSLVAIPGKAPTASFTSSENTGAAPLTVRFDASGSRGPSGPPTGMFWDFGDGTVSSGTIVTHSYTHPGFYQPTLAVSDSVGEVASVDGDLISATGPSASRDIVGLQPWGGKGSTRLLFAESGTAISIGGALLLLVGLGFTLRRRTVLVARCDCGQALPDDGRFCDHCGRPVGFARQ